MKTLVPVSSKERNPTTAADYNEAISYDYLLLVNGRYARGCYSFVTNRWMIIEQFKLIVSVEPPSMDDLNREVDWNVEDLIWYEEI